MKKSPTGAGGLGCASVFAISKRFNSFSAFFTKSREQLKSKVQGVLQFFGISKSFSAFFTKSREQLKLKVQRMLQFLEFQKVF
jgi:hypothetical protein